MRNENGASLVIVALAMVALLGFTAIVIDGGRLYTEKSKLQKALDAAVLAGAHGLVVNDVQAKTIAKDVSVKNGYDLESSEIDAVVKNYIEAEKTVQVPMTFAKVLNFNTVPVTARAKAIVSPLKTGIGIAPIAVEASMVPNGTDLICKKEPLTDDTSSSNGNSGNNGNNGNNGGPNHSSGNCGFLQLDGPGASSLASALVNGGTFTVDQEYATTEPGGMWGQVDTAVKTLIQQDIDAGRTYCSDFSTADNSCSRVINVVVIEKWDAEGRDQVKVVGFAAYWIEGFFLQGGPDKYLRGRFISSISKGEIEEMTGGGSWEDNLLYGVKLAG
ncbi:TadE/TadG family type IV pilus assembly protein [Mesobacillus campisalis]|uniref:TadE/TadG family type IV pilus assembly protein n=1 Tax=Mesobacillus campisalis TaxID=1408103 RepID=UPI00138F0520|nr:TadE/TadG family type IV pilus assembly protein [Mesobacillus campisalis]